MDWIKQSPSPASTTTQQEDAAAVNHEEELSLIKAAVWAWYQRGSANNNDDESKPNTGRESELSRPRTSPATPRPTRYKLEAQNPAHLPTLTSTSHLLDLYEIERITRELKDFIIGSGKKDSGSEPVRKGKRVNGLWAPQGMGICRGSRDDVVEAAVLGGRRRGKPRAVV